MRSVHDALSKWSRLASARQRLMHSALAIMHQAMRAGFAAWLEEISLIQSRRSQTLQATAAVRFRLSLAGISGWARHGLFSAIRLGFSSWAEAAARFRLIRRSLMQFSSKLRLLHSALATWRDLRVKLRLVQRAACTRHRRMFSFGFGCWAAHAAQEKLAARATFWRRARQISAWSCWCRVASERRLMQQASANSSDRCSYYYQYYLLKYKSIDGSSSSSSSNSSSLLSGSGGALQRAYVESHPGRALSVMYALDV